MWPEARRTELKMKQQYFECVGCVGNRSPEDNRCRPAGENEEVQPEHSKRLSGLGV